MGYDITFLALLWSFLTIAIAGFLSYYYIFTSSWSKRECWHIKDANLRPKVSIIIPAYNEERSIARKLENTLALDYPRDRLEIIVIDSASTDKTANIVEEFIMSHSIIPIKFIREDKRIGKSHALNRALSQCTGDLVAITDADSTLDLASLKLAVHNFADPRVGAVTGKILVRNVESSNTTRSEGSYRELYDTFRLGESRHYSTFIFNGPLAVFRRNALERFYPGADDTGTAMEMILKGYRTIYEPDALVYENASPGYRAMFAQKLRRGLNIVDVLISSNSKLHAMHVDAEFVKIHRLNVVLHIVMPFAFLCWLILSAIMLLMNPTLILIGIIGGILYLVPKTRKLIHTMGSFTSSQIILVQSMIKYALGERYVVWPIINEVRDGTDGPTI